LLGSFFLWSQRHGVRSGVFRILVKSLFEILLRLSRCTSAITAFVCCFFASQQGLIVGLFN